MSGIRLVVSALLIIIMAESLAQDSIPKTNTCRCSFQSINQVGLLDGENRPAFQVQSINGIRYRNWYAGLGIGLDYYFKRGIPVFIDIRNYWWNRANSPFVYGDAGIHFTWPRVEDKLGGSKTDFNNGLYYDLGLGYKTGLKNRHSLLLSAGYSYKDIREKRSSVICPFLPPCRESVDIYHYKLNRLSLKLGWQF